MNQTTIEKHLSEIFENLLRDFFAETLIERLEDAKKHFDKIEIGQRIDGRFLPFEGKEVNFPELRTVVEKVSLYIQEGYAGKKGSQHEEFILKLHDRELQGYLNHKWQETFYLLMPLFLTTFYLFDETGSKLLSQELRDDLLRKSGLDNAKKRKEACLRYLGHLLLDQAVTHGGSEGFWDKKKRLQLLVFYNRFFFVFKNARNDKKRLRKQKLPDTEIQKQIQKKYEIPLECVEDIFQSDSNADVALKWAKKELKNDDSNEHLRNRILRQARSENKVMARNRKPGLLVDFCEREGAIVSHYIIDPKNKADTEQLKYISHYILHPPELEKIEVW